MKTLFIFANDKVIWSGRFGSHDVRFALVADEPGTEMVKVESAHKIGTRNENGLCMRPMNRRPIEQLLKEKRPHLKIMRVVNGALQELR